MNNEFKSNHVGDENSKSNENQTVFNESLNKNQEIENINIESLNKVKEYNLEKGVGILVDKIKEKILESNEPIIVEIAGGSASGKTSAVASKVKEVFNEDALILSMDDYYRGKTFMNNEEQKGNVLNWDQPEALNLELLQKQIDELKQGKPIEKPIYSMKTGEPSGTEILEPKKVIIIEGLFALNEKLISNADLKAFVDIGTHGRIIRRLLRDIQRTGQKPADILNYFSEIVEPMHEKYIQNTSVNADLIVKNEYSPSIEAERSGLHEVQLKFKVDLDSEQLRKIGAERLSITKQVDNYYNPKDRNLMESGEILRIRDEGDSKILTYKGPKKDSEYRKRPKFEFEIDSDIEKKFLSIYGDKIKKIEKTRTMYQLDGVTFSNDNVQIIENDSKKNLGNFIEIRSTDKDTNEEKIQQVISKLGLKPSEGIKESYFEM